MQVVVTFEGAAGSKLDVKLEAPGSFMECLDIQQAVRRSRDPHRPALAALGLCLPHVRRRVAYAGDPVAFGGQVGDYLVAEGWSLKSLLAAARKAVDLCVDQVAGLERRLDATLGNSEAPKGGTP